MRNIFCCLLLISLSSCAWMRPEPKIITKEVEVLVTVPCVEEEKLPGKVERETDTLVKEDDIFRKAQALLADNNSLEANNLVLWALIIPCVAD